MAASFSMFVFTPTTLKNQLKFKPQPVSVFRKVGVFAFGVKQPENLASLAVGGGSELTTTHVATSFAFVLFKLFAFVLFKLFTFVLFKLFTFVLFKLFALVLFKLR